MKVKYPNLSYRFLKVKNSVMKFLSKPKSSKNSLETLPFLTEIQSKSISLNIYIHIIESKCNILKLYNHLKYINHQNKGMFQNSWLRERTEYCSVSPHKQRTKAYLTFPVSN